MMQLGDECANRRHESAERERVVEIRPRLDYYPSTFDLINKGAIDKAIRQIQEQHNELTRALVHYGAYHADLMRAVQELNELNSGIMTDLQKTMDQVHRSWFTELGDVVSSIQLASMARLTLTDVSYQLAVTKPLFEEIDFDLLGNHLDVQMSLMSEVQHSISAFWASFGNLAASFQGLDDIVKLPAFVLPGATRELSTTSQALDMLYPLEHRTDTEVVELEPYPLVEAETGDHDLIALLERVDPQFVTMYRGAVGALDGDNPDRSRHVLTSFRELWNHLLRKLAPKEEVTEWIEENRTQGYLHDGRPTRHAKIRYVLKDIGDESLRDFVEADAKAMVQLYSLYGRLHEMDIGVTDEQLHAITIRTESYLSYLLRVQEWSKE